MKIPLWGTIFTVLAVIVLCSLGTWQVKRAVWKYDLLERITAEYEVTSATVDLDPSVDLSKSLLKRGFLKGQFIHDKAILIQARTYKGNPGYHLVTPFEMADHDGKVVFVNRGWVPVGAKIMEDYIKKPEGLMMITGTLRPPPKSNSFVPDNIPDKDEWYQIKPEQIASAKGIDGFYTNVFYKESRGAKRGIPDLPIALGAKVNIRNNHAGYAFFWFTMAIALIVVYVLRFIAPQFRKKFK